MKTKILKILCALIFATSMLAAQVPFFNVFLGGTDFAPNGTNDMSEPSNYYTFSKDGEETTKLWGFDNKIDISGKGVPLQSMQTINSSKWFAYGDINYTNDDGESTLYTSPKNLFMKNSLSVSGGQPHAFFRYSGTATVTFGSFDSQDEEFLYYTNSFHNIGHGTVSFVRDANAAQNTFSFRISAEAKFQNGTTIIGDASKKDGYFDSVKMANTEINYTGNLEIYAKSINFGSYLKADTTGTLTVYIPDQALIKNTPLVKIEGEFQHLDKVVFDFTNYENIGAGEYTLISADSLGEGFNVDTPSDDIEIRHLKLQNGYTSELKWVNESNLMLTVSVPEPYEAAAVIGIIALALAVYRRRI